MQPGEVSPWTTLQPNYIASLLAEPHIDGLIAARPDPAASGVGTSLLQTLLRHAMLHELSHAAASIAGSAPGASVAALLRDQELIDLVTGAPPTLTWKRQLDSKVPVITGDRSIRQFLEAFLQGAPTTGKPADRVEYLIGSLASGVPDLAERHREYVLAALKHGR